MGILLPYQSTKNAFLSIFPMKANPKSANRNYSKHKRSCRLYLFKYLFEQVELC